jgi:hypothetical protein
MNADTHDDLLSETNMSERGYIITLMIFFIIYAYAAEILLPITKLAYVSPD